MKKWYVVHTYSGYEKKVKAALENRIETLGMADKIFKVEIPTEQVVNKDDGKLVEKNLFPGYILVQMEFDESSWYVVRNTDGVTGFVGSRHKPTPLTRAEYYRMVGHTKKTEPVVVTSFEVGETVRIKQGPFADYNARIQEVNADKGTLRCTVTLFGRETPVEFEFKDVELVYS